MQHRKSETRSRARALQALYAWDLRDGQSLERVAEQMWNDLAVAPAERARAGKIVRTVVRNEKEIDAALREITTNWRLERLGVIERSVLRLAAAELMGGETPPRVVIQEAVRLAERFGSPQSAKFVNGVIDALAREMGRL
ncbi:MAG: transcription antitermination factor NusB [Gemmatimonadaceae bacterium]